MVLSEVPSIHGIRVQRLRIRNQSKPQTRLKKDKELVKEAMSDDPLILCLRSSSTTRFVISFSSKEIPNVTGTVKVPEMHLTVHSAAQVRKLDPLFAM